MVQTGRKSRVAMRMPPSHATLRAPRWALHVLRRWSCLCFRLCGARTWEDGHPWPSHVAIARFPCRESGTTTHGRHFI